MDIRKHPRAAYWGAWALAGLYNFLREIFAGAKLFGLVFNVAHFGLWGCLGLLAVPLARRHPLRLHWRPWVFHLLVGSAFTLADVVLGHWISFRVMGVGRELDFLGIARVAVKDCFHLGLLTYWAMVGVVQGLDAQRRSRERELHATRLEARLAEARLQSLKTQLQPHFLFNALNAVASLMYEDVATADRVLTRLSEVLRLSLGRGEDAEVTLREELAFLEACLEIEQIRFEGRLRVEMQVPGRLLGAAVPTFILQPLVENAVKHGVAPRGGGGALVIRAREEAGELRLEVEDDGPGLRTDQPGFGIGIRNTRDRLEHLYGEAAGFELVREGTGTVARVRLPFRDGFRAGLRNGAAA